MASIATSSHVPALDEPHREGTTAGRHLAVHRRAAIADQWDYELLPDWRFRLYHDLAASDPRVQARVETVGQLVGIRVVVSELIPDAAIFSIEQPGGQARLLAVSRWDRYGYPYGWEGVLGLSIPLYTRATLGGREAARDVRRKRKGLRS